MKNKMNESPIIAPKRRSRRLLIGAAGVVFILLAGAWTYAWARARDIVTGNMDAWLAHEVAAGRLHECANRRIGGYPFLIEIDCDSPIIRFTQAGDLVAARFSHLKTAALIYAPEHVITDFSAPFTLEREGNIVAQVDFTRAQGSYRQKGRPFERFSLTVDDLRVNIPVGTSQFSAGHMELHVRPEGGRTLLIFPADFDFAFNARDFRLKETAAGQGVDIVCSAALRRWPAFSDASNHLLADWARGGGKIDIKELRLKRDSGQLLAQGDLQFNNTGRGDGHFDAKVINPAAFLRGLVMQGQNDSGVLFGPLLMAAGKPADLDGQRATEFHLRLENGVLAMGKLVLGEFPPAY